MKKCPYEILGLPFGASLAEVKQAYRRLAMQHHPDRGGVSEQFDTHTQAYKFLSNKTRKASYDKDGDLDKFDLVDSLAHETIANLYLTIAETMDWPEYDFRQRIEQGLALAASEAEKDLGEFRYNLSKFDKCTGNLKGSKVFDNIVAHKRLMLLTDIEWAEEAVCVIGRAKELFSKYEFTGTDALPHQKWGAAYQCS